MRICKICKVEKKLDEFIKAARCKEGRGNICKVCSNNKYRQYRNDYYNKRRKTDPEFHKNELNRKANWRSKLKNQQKEKRYREVNKDQINSRSKLWYQVNKQKNRERNIRWIKNNPERHKFHVAKKNKARKLDPLRNLEDRIRNIIYLNFKENGYIKSQNTFDLLGYSGQELYLHLKNQLNHKCIICKKIKLTLKNCNIDHIIPMCSAKSKEDIIKLNKLENLRLLCKNCNNEKITSDIQFSWRRKKST